MDVDKNELIQSHGTDQELIYESSKNHFLNENKYLTDLPICTNVSRDMDLSVSPTFGEAGIGTFAKLNELSVTSYAGIGATSYVGRDMDLSVSPTFGEAGIGTFAKLNEFGMWKRNPDTPTGINYVAVSKKIKDKISRIIKNSTIEGEKSQYEIEYISNGDANSYVINVYLCVFGDIIGNENHIGDNIILIER